MFHHVSKSWQTLGNISEKHRETSNVSEFGRKHFCFPGSKFCFRNNVSTGGQTWKHLMKKRESQMFPQQCFLVCPGLNNGLWPFSDQNANMSVYWLLCADSIYMYCICHYMTIHFATLIGKSSCKTKAQHFTTLLHMPRKLLLRKSNRVYSSLYIYIKIGTWRVHVSAKKLDSHFVFSWKELNNEDDMGQLKYFITYYNSR
jgi:hypothetical protein